MEKSLSIDLVIVNPITREIFGYKNKFFILSFRFNDLDEWFGGDFDGSLLDFHFHYDESFSLGVYVDKNYSGSTKDVEVKVVYSEKEKTNILNNNIIMDTPILERDHVISMLDFDVLEDAYPEDVDSDQITAEITEFVDRNTGYDVQIEHEEEEGLMIYAFYGDDTMDIQYIEFDKYLNKTI